MLTGYEITNVDAEHVGMTVDGQIVLVRKQDRTINATQITKLTHKGPKEQRKTLHCLRRANDYEIRPMGKTQNTWVSIQCGKELCVKLGLEEKLRPLLYHGSDNVGEMGEVNLSLTSGDAIHADRFRDKIWNGILQDDG